MPPETCPHCGADVPANAKACPECGSDETTGWSEAAAADHLGLPEEEFDYDAFVQDEFGKSSPALRPLGLSWFWWIVAMILLAALVFFLFPL